MSKPRFLIIMLVIAIWLSTTAFQVIPQPAASVMAAPGAFGKTSPADKANNTSIQITLSWGEATGAVRYDYCIDTTANSQCDLLPDGSSAWKPVGLAREVVLPPLTPDVTYYWNVRAVDSAGRTTYADGINESFFWAFTTQDVPVAFGKAKPNNVATPSLSVPINLIWGNSAEFDNYEYCYDTTNDNVCEDDAWLNAGTNTTMTLNKGDVDAGATYYWQVRARNWNGTREANAGTWWTFSVNPAPATFSKSTPTNGQTKRSVTPTFTWATTTGAQSYEYCYDTTNDSACENDDWTNVGTASTATITTPLTNDTVYYWQVRAVGVNGDTEANDGTWWSFRTIPLPPTDFAKTAPEDGATNVPITQVLSWGTSDHAVYYEYCIDTTHDTTCQGTWKNMNLSTSDAPELQYSTTYYWQVRAHNDAADKYADASAWYSFTTVDAPPPPDAFDKVSLANGAQDVPTYLALKWQTTTGATKYEYCYDTTDNDTCDSGKWLKPDANTYALVYGLDPSTTYYWQVRAVNDFGSTEANAGEWWSFKTNKYGHILFMGVVRK